MERLVPVIGTLPDFVNGLQPLLAGQAAHVVGEQLTTRTTLDIHAPNT